MRGGVVLEDAEGEGKTLLEGFMDEGGEEEAPGLGSGVDGSGVMIVAFMRQG